MTVQDFKYDDWFDGEDSTAVASAYYDSETEQVAITLTGGLTYVYQNFPLSTWYDFQLADSLGTFYANNIKGDFQRNGGFSQYDEFNFVKRTKHLSAVKDASQGSTTTTIVIAIDGRLTLELPGEVNAQDALNGFINTFKVDSGGEFVGQPRVISRSVTRVETF